MNVGLVRDLARDRDEEAALHVDDALRPAGRARRVRRAGTASPIDLAARQLAGLLVDELVPRRGDRRARREARRARASSRISSIGTGLPRRGDSSA